MSDTCIQCGRPRTWADASVVLCSRCLEERPKYTMLSPPGRVRGGSMRRPDPDAPGGYTVVQPGEPAYSSMLMVATEYWDGERWRSIEGDV